MKHKMNDIISISGKIGQQDMPLILKCIASSLDFWDVVLPVKYVMERANISVQVLKMRENRFWRTLVLSGRHRTIKRGLHNRFRTLWSFSTPPFPIFLLQSYAFFSESYHIFSVKISVPAPWWVYIWGIIWQNESSERVCRWKRRWRLVHSPGWHETSIVIVSVQRIIVIATRAKYYKELIWFEL